ncbi:hypothetical protein HNQ99_003018 [Rhizorhapis suberifaciens]|uniref:Uncharacterized protein n=1 Tax=Rhizorhapis suberifaciens TaxID=13656 RepID=A0A840HWH2_9SPHN|nr:hypothetical protein [Rhizorhapis suberifaciens]
MKLGSALAFLALAALTPSVPAVAAKDDKLPRCNGRQKRPANLYGTVLPSIPARNATSAAVAPPPDGVPRGTPARPSSQTPTQNLFPPEGPAPAPEGPDTSRADKVPAIGALGTGTGPTAALPTTYASC